jgi:hypothetical protein
MAIEVLCHADSQAIIQKPNHDLESIFYILLCFCLRYDGPHGQRVNLGPMPVDKFYLANESYDSLATWKTGVLFEYEDWVLRHIPPYFADLKECLCQLLDHVFCPHQGTGPNGDIVVLRAFHKNDATHDVMLEVLENMLAQLPDVDTVPPCTSAGKRSAEPFHFIPYTASDSGFNSPSRSRTCSSNRKANGSAWSKPKPKPKPKPKLTEPVAQPNVPSSSVSRGGGEGSSSSKAPLLNRRGRSDSAVIQLHREQNVGSPVSKKCKNS